MADPYYSEMKRAKKFMERYEQLGYDFGIPKKCVCGERIIDEISVTEVETGKRYFTCSKFKVRLDDSFFC